jgi:hypothetical protein
MYLQDHKGFFPGVNWSSDIETYVGSRKMFCCPDDSKAKQVIEPVNYGYNGLLIRTDGRGVKEFQFPTPTEVGVFCDASPARPWSEGGGLIFGAPLRESPTVSPAFRHGRVIVIGYADGHAGVSTFSNKRVEIRKLSDKYSRAFYQTQMLGSLNNPIGGVRDFRMIANPDTTPFTIGGESCGRLLLEAAAKAWSVKTGTPFTRAWHNQTRTAQRGRHYVWISADGEKPKGPAVPIARDAMVVIVNPNTKVPLGHGFSREGEGSDRSYNITTAFLRGVFGNPDGAPYFNASGYCANAYQAYSFRPDSGSYRFFTGKFGKQGVPLAIPSGKDSLVEWVDDDYEMVERVANDPYGVGYCTAGVADSIKVKIVGIDGHRYPTDRTDREGRYQDIVPATPSPTWPLVRTLYAEFGGNTWKADGTGIGNVMLAPGSPGKQALEAAPMFVMGYHRP